MDDWVTIFFESPNEWCSEKINDGNCPLELQENLTKIYQSAVKGTMPAILPRLSDNNQYSFYIIGENNQQLGELRRCLKANFDDTYFYFFDETILVSEDYIEKNLLKSFPFGFVCLRARSVFAVDISRINSLMNGLSRLIKVFREKPSFKTNAKRPTGRILRDFFNAINFGQSNAALDYLAELRSRRLLTPLNLLSLEFQGLAAGNRWNEILNDKKRLFDALTGASSRNVTLVILRALRATSLHPNVINETSCDDFRHLYREFQPIFKTPPDISITFQNEWVVWSIGAVAFGYEQFFEALPDNIEKCAWIKKLVDWKGGAAQFIVKDPIQSILTETAPSEETAAKLLAESAFSNETDAKKIYDLLCGYPHEILKVVTKKPGFSAFWHELRSNSGELSLTNWGDVIAALRSDKPVSAVLRQLNHYLTDWDPKDWDEALLTEVIDAEDTPLLRDILPHLLNWLQQHTIFLSKENLLGILESLAADDTVSSQDLNLSSDILRFLVTDAVTPSEYSDAIDWLELIWIKVKSRDSINYYLDAIDVLADGTCANPGRRALLWTNCQEFLIRQWLRLDESQRLTASELAADLIGNTGQFPSIHRPQEAVESIGDVKLIGKKLAIYSLTEGAGRRAAAVLEKKYPGLQVFLNHDKTATSNLKNLAKTADFFIFSARSAAHQAWYPVSDIRKDLIYPAGKGTSSIVRAFVNKLQFPSMSLQPTN